MSANRGWTEDDSAASLAGPWAVRRKGKCPAGFTIAIIVVMTAGGASANADEMQLAEAAKRQDTAAVRALLENKVDVNIPQPDGATALHWAAYWDDLKTLELLLSAGARATVANDYGVTPLSLACTNRNGAMVEKLVAAGADPNAASSTGETVLMTCAYTGSPVAVKALLSAGANVNANERLQGQTALMWAAAEGHTAVVRLLVEAGADIGARSQVTRHFICFEQQCGHKNKNEYRERGAFTPLLFAARRGDVDSARVLLSAGASLEETAADGYTPLMVASHSRHTPLAKFLLDQGADPNRSGAGYSALHTAVVRGDVELVNVLLAHGADPNARITKPAPMTRFDYGWILPLEVVGYTPLLQAAKYAEVEIMRALLAGGADPSATTTEGTTALMAAVGVGLGAGGSRDRRGRTLDAAEVGAELDDEPRTLEAVRLLLDTGSADVNATNASGGTALHVAATNGFKHVLQYLAERGGKLDVTNKAGATPLTLLDRVSRTGR